MHELLHHLLHLITHFGDSGLLVVLSFFASVYLYLAGSHRAALALCGAMLGCVAIMTILKISFHSCHQLVPSLDIVSPSGHAALSAAVMGSFAAIFISHFEGWRKILPPVIAFFMIAAISASRVLLHYHTVNEVIAGLLIGLGLAFAAYSFLNRAEKVPFKARHLVVTAALATILFYGTQTPAETFIIHLADLLKQTLGVCT